MTSFFFDSMTSSSFLCIGTPKTSNLFNFHRIKLKVGLGGGGGGRVDIKTLISILTQKLDFKCQDLTTKGIIPSIFVTYGFNRWSP